MLIAIISDTHDNIPNLKKFLKFAQDNKIEAILHCGDITSGEAINNLAENFSGEIFLVYGNADAGHLKEIQEAAEGKNNIHLLGDEGEVELGGSPTPDGLRRASKKIAFCHFPERVKELAQEQKYDLVFHGHTHQPWIENIGRTVLANPGTLAGMFSKATFAVYDTSTNNLELKILERLK